MYTEDFEPYGSRSVSISPGLAAEEIVDMNKVNDRIDAQDMQIRSYTLRTPPESPYKSSESRVAARRALRRNLRQEKIRQYESNGWAQFTRPFRPGKPNSMLGSKQSSIEFAAWEHEQIAPACAAARAAEAEMYEKEMQAELAPYLELCQYIPAPTEPNDWFCSDQELSRSRKYSAEHSKEPNIDQECRKQAEELIPRHRQFWLNDAHGKGFRCSARVRVAVEKQIQTDYERFLQAKMNRQDMSRNANEARV